MSTRIYIALTFDAKSQANIPEQNIKVDENERLKDKHDFFLIELIYRSSTDSETPSDRCVLSWYDYGYLFGPISDSLFR